MWVCFVFIGPNATPSAWAWGARVLRSGLREAKSAVLGGRVSVTLRTGRSAVGDKGYQTAGVWYPSGIVRILHLHFHLHPPTQLFCTRSAPWRGFNLCLTFW